MCQMLIKSLIVYGAKFASEIPCTLREIADTLKGWHKIGKPCEEFGRRTKGRVRLPCGTTIIHTMPAKKWKKLCLDISLHHLAPPLCTIQKQTFKSWALTPTIMYPPQRTSPASIKCYRCSRNHLVKDCPKLAPPRKRLPPKCYCKGFIWNISPNIVH